MSRRSRARSSSLLELRGTMQRLTHLLYPVQPLIGAKPANASEPVLKSPLRRPTGELLCASLLFQCSKQHPWMTTMHSRVQIADVYALRVGHSLLSSSNRAGTSLSVPSDTFATATGRRQQETRCERVAERTEADVPILIDVLERRREEGAGQDNDANAFAQPFCDKLGRDAGVWMLDLRDENGQFSSTCGMSFGWESGADVRRQSTRRRRRPPSPRRSRSSP